MRYLSIDLEATGLDSDDLIIEFAAVPFDTKRREILEDLSFHRYLNCPSFTELKPQLSQWVIDHNKDLIDKAHAEGLSTEVFKEEFANYLDSQALRSYLGKDSYVIFGKSLNAIDLPFLYRDLGAEFMNHYFLHRVLDVSSAGHLLSDLPFFPSGLQSGSKLMKYYKMGNVAHNALDDAVNTIKLYFNILDDVEKIKDRP